MICAARSCILFLLCLFFHNLSMKVLAVSCITNMATGIQTVKHSHARVLEIANQAGDTMCRWLGAVIQRM